MTVSGFIAGAPVTLDGGGLLAPAGFVVRKGNDAFREALGPKVKVIDVAALRAGVRLAEVGRG